MTTPELSRSYWLLGLGPGASIKDVEAAYKKLRKRSDPARFTYGSEEERMANLICKRLDEAYQQLRDALS